MSGGWRWLTRRGAFSLRLRLMFGSAVLAVIFMLALLPVLRSAFLIALEQSVEKRLAADAGALIAAARTENGRLSMPSKLPDEEFNIPDAQLLGFIYDRDGKLIWQSRTAKGISVGYLPRYDGSGNRLLRVYDREGNAFYLYDVEVDLLRGESAAFSIVTLQPDSDTRALYNGFMKQLYLWLALALLLLLGLLWFGLTWGFRSLRGLRRELDEVESGSRERLSDQHPSELLRLTGSLNRLLDSERQQRERYRHSLDDLAHSLKTPLSVLQGTSEVIAARPENREQTRVLQAQIERMSQQIGYQLQRASLRKSGLIRHRVLLAHVVDNLCEALDKVYRDKQVRVLRDFDLWLEIPMERVALLELLGNLLENAYRLGLGQISIGARIAQGVCEISVEDDGPGVPEDQRERILRRGERLDAQHPGQGIGTAVVNDILESYGGELQVGESSLGGAAFRIRF